MQGLKAELMLQPRQDLLMSLIRLVSPTDDLCDIEVRACTPVPLTWPQMHRAFSVVALSSFRELCPRQAPQALLQPCVVQPPAAADRGGRHGTDAHDDDSDSKL